MNEERIGRDAWRCIANLLNPIDSNSLRVCCAFLRDTVPRKRALIHIHLKLILAIDRLLDAIDSANFARTCLCFFHWIPKRFSPILVFARSYNILNYRAGLLPVQYS